MRTIIKIVCENTVTPSLDLIGEHGLSVLIQKDETVLFDCGQGKGLLHNMGSMQIDPTGIDRVIISHGHYDHIGGLMPLLHEYRKLQHTRQLPVHIEKSAFLPKWSVRTGEKKYIGAAFSEEEYVKAGVQFTYLNESQKISNGIYAFARIARNENWKGADASLKIEHNGIFTDDPFNDDASLLVETSYGPVVVLGCAHAGIIEILKFISAASGEKKFYGVFGGAHLSRAPEDFVKDVIHTFEKYEVQHIGLNHCTGFATVGLIASHFSSKVNSAAAGAEFNL